MNRDHFEQRLSKQSLRPMPAAWREEILASARTDAVAAASDGLSDQTHPFWKIILARFPVGWGTLAALWAVLIAINAWVFSSTSTGPVRSHALAAAIEPLTVWQLQRAEFRQLAEGDENLSAETPAHAAPPPDVPRCERRHDEGSFVFLSRDFQAYDT